MKLVLAVLAFAMFAGLFCCTVYTPSSTRATEGVEASSRDAGSRTGEADAGDPVYAAAAARESLIAYLENRNRELEVSHQKFFSFYMCLTATILTGAVILTLLNVKEGRRKDRIIFNSEQFLRQSIQVQEEERRRISLELHDSVAQDMRCVSLVAEGSTDREAAEKILGIQTKCIESIRKLCYNLTPPSFTGGNLVPSVISMGQKIFDTENFGFQFRVACEPSVDFGRWNNDELMSLYRIVQEALQNIQKHANASEVTVFFKKVEPDSLKLIITDDGCGMDEDLVAQINAGSFEGVEAMHFGLRNIFERAKLLGGKVTYYSMGEGCGTRLSVEI